MKPTTRWILGVVVLGLAGGGLFLYLRERGIRRALDASAAVERSLYEEALRRDDRRPTLGEARADGDARDVYEEVLPQIAALEEEELESDDGVGLLHWVSTTESCHCDEIGLSDDGTPPAVQVADYVQRTRPLLDRLADALRRPRCSRTLTLVFPPPDDDDAPAWQTVSTLVDLHVLRDLAAGDVDDALDLCVLRWFVGWDQARGGSLLAHMVGVALASDSIAGIRRILADAPVPPDRLDRLAREVAFLRRQKQDVRQAYRIDEMRLRREFRRQSAEAGFLSPDRALLLDALARIGPTRAAFDHAVVGKEGREAEPAARAVLDTLDPEENPLLKMFFVVYPIAVRKHEELRALETLLEAGIALARHRAHEGRLPDALDDLVPRYLDVLPVSPWSKAPLRYDSEKLWAIGPDGVDQHGEVRIRDDDSFDDDGDAILTLYTDTLSPVPWSDDVDDETRAKAEAALEALRDPDGEHEEATAALVALGPVVMGRLVGEFARIEAEAGFDTAEGRRQVAAVDGVLRALDGHLACRWLSFETDADTPEAARRTALRWTNGRRRRVWERTPLDPWEP